MTTTAITLRTALPEETPFLFQVYASTRFAELAPLGWSDEQAGMFLAQQFAAQQQHYQAHFADAAFLVILVNDEPAGRLTVARRPQETLVVDLALLPPFRGVGIGTQLLRGLLAEAAAAAKPVRLHVEKQNRALGLYRRLGFIPIEDRGVYWFLEWQPAQKELA